MGNEQEMVLFNKQRYEFFSKSQLLGRLFVIMVGCCSISKDTNFSANHNRSNKSENKDEGVVQ